MNTLSRQISGSEVLNSLNLSTVKNLIQFRSQKYKILRLKIQTWIAQRDENSKNIQQFFASSSLPFYQSCLSSYFQLLHIKFQNSHDMDNYKHHAQNTHVRYKKKAHRSEVVVIHIYQLSLMVRIDIKSRLTISWLS